MSNKQNWTQVPKEGKEEHVNNIGEKEPDWTQVPKGTTITVATFNMQEKQLSLEKLGEERPDVIVIQEAQPDGKIQLLGYTLIYLRGPSDNDMMSALVHTDSKWKIKDFVEYSTEKCFTPRKNYVLEIQLKSDNHQTLKIGNVHLCGGMFDEEDLYKKPSKKEKTKTIKDLENIKKEILEKMVEYGTDLILGDFNSDMNHFVKGKPIKSHETYLKDQGLNGDQIRAWNTTPFNYLKSQGYSMVEPPETKTSLYDTTPDAIWYIPGTLALDSSYDINMISDESSDHNGLVATFIVSSGNEKKGKGKEKGNEKGKGKGKEKEKEKEKGKEKEKKGKGKGKEKGKEKKGKDKKGKEKKGKEKKGKEKKEEEKKEEEKENKLTSLEKKFIELGTGIPKKLFEAAREETEEEETEKYYNLLNFQYIVRKLKKNNAKLTKVVEFVATKDKRWLTEKQQAAAAKNCAYNLERGKLQTDALDQEEKTSLKKEYCVRPS